MLKINDTKTTLLKSSKFFNIGDFQIRAQNNNDSMNELVNIPGSFMAFENNCDKTVDFQFIIDKQQSIVRGKQLFCAENFMRNAIYECDNDSWEWVRYGANDELVLDFKIKKDFSEIVLTKMSMSERILETELGYLFAYAALQKDACVLHGVIMEYDDRGILVLAKSGVGKSTHTRLWRDVERALIINGDRCLCRRMDGIWYAYGMPWCGNSGEYINRRVPITDIVFLERGIENQVEKVDAFAGTLRLLESVKAPVWSKELYTKAMDYCQELGQTIKMWNLKCTPDSRSVKALKQALFIGEL